ncbi:hypothetical protein [Actinoalloteichus spitiensis]|uniref:hypothetical protein n=1 Tax=Actinoalloteichus spitiensis TaxID=252394 RepID=UPI000376A9BF|nr:hypothetical protein [Actinoalloteichus spitiensis]
MAVAEPTSGALRAEVVLVPGRPGAGSSGNSAELRWWCPPGGTAPDTLRGALTAVVGFAFAGLALGWLWMRRTPEADGLAGALGFRQGRPPDPAWCGGAGAAHALPWCMAATGSAVEAGPAHTEPHRA